MKYLIFLLFFLLAVIGLAFYYFFNVLPEKLSDSLIREEASSPIPKKIIEKGQSLGFEAPDSPEQIAELLKKKKTDIDDLKKLVEEVEFEQMENFLEQASHSNLVSADSAFLFFKDNFDMEGFPIDSFETEFHLYFDSAKMSRAIELYQNNKNQMPVLFPVLKKTVIKYLDEIRELQLSDSSAVNEIQ